MSAETNENAVFKFGYAEPQLILSKYSEKHTFKQISATPKADIFSSAIVGRICNVFRQVDKLNAVGLQASDNLLEFIPSGIVPTVGMSLQIEGVAMAPAAKIIDEKFVVIRIVVWIFHL